MYFTTNQGLAIIFDLGGVVFRYYGHEIDALVPGKIHKSPFYPVDDMIKLIQRCREQVDAQGARKHQLYILSNFSRSSFELLKQFHQPVLDLFDGHVLSGHVGYAKPDRRIYEHLLDTYNLAAQSCIFIDDEESKVTAACALGMHGIVCDTVPNVEQALRIRGVFALE